jgi:hypothetical protein
MEPYFLTSFVYCTLNLRPQQELPLYSIIIIIIIIIIICKNSEVKWVISE